MTLPDPSPSQPSYTLKQRFLLWCLPPIGGFLLRVWAASWRVRMACPPHLDPHNAVEPIIYAFWHEGVVTVIPHWRDCRIQGLASQSFDGELIARAMISLGYPPVARGSSSRGGAQAFESQRRALADGFHIAITVDGPRGPAYQAKPGAVRLAALSGKVIVPVASACKPDTRLRSWDRSQLPPPLGRVAFVFGEPIQVQEGGEAEAQILLKKALDQAVDEAKILVG